MQSPELILNPAADVPPAFVRSAGDHLSMLKEALLFDDYDRVRMVARSLKRMCGSMASWQMKALAGQLERLDSRSFGQALAVLKALDAELDGVRRAGHAT
jgi:HPt (histidine-containing phosphotransfer) domain-containing protein